MAVWPGMALRWHPGTTTTAAAAAAVASEEQAFPLDDPRALPTRRRRAGWWMVDGGWWMAAICLRQWPVASLPHGLRSGSRANRRRFDPCRAGSACAPKPAGRRLALESRPAAYLSRGDSSGTPALVAQEPDRRYIGAAHGSAVPGDGDSSTQAGSAMESKHSASKQTRRHMSSSAPAGSFVGSHCQPVAGP
ncbi:hypothetical protein P171DRAFT_507786 [Karstenula rhodostoma CBS 690.94]|uniref:Uncharacterized protein n=1 Tax=Karstenula rhodostoma CBS 690.94 TaxID=1392251 RepID=A0A9P4PTM7_9PLEO|nr:hypothetical protein P171DRAFT_507786 [Karstenula rhodostoma CBS 690.94]